MTHTCFTQENSIFLATAFYTLSNQQCPLYPSGAWLLSSFAKEVTPQGLASENWPCISHVCIHYCSFLILCFFPSIKTLKDLILFVLWLNKCFQQVPLVFKLISIQKAFSLVYLIAYPACHKRFLRMRVEDQGLGFSWFHLYCS